MPSSGEKLDRPKANADTENLINGDLNGKNVLTIYGLTKLIAYLITHYNHLVRIKT